MSLVGGGRSLLVLNVLTIKFFSVVLLLRTYALYRRDRRALVFLVFTAACLFSLSCVRPWSIWCNEVIPNLQNSFSGLSQVNLRPSVSFIPAIGVCHKLRTWTIE